MRCYLVKFQSCLFGQLCNFEFCKFHRIFFENCATEENQISFAMSICDELALNLLLEQNNNYCY